MINGVLETVIAIVVVLLVLSLIVQSAQSALKKLFKIKSRQLEESLVDLFENFLNQPETQAKWLSKLAQASPMLKGLISALGGGVAWLRGLAFSVMRMTPPAPSESTARVLTEKVKERFRQVGRVAQSGKAMLESISKDDLIKVLEKVAPALISDGFPAKIKDAVEDYQSVKTSIEEIEKVATQLSGDANSKFAAVQQTLAPILNDVKSLLDGTFVKSVTNGQTVTNGLDGQPVTPEGRTELLLEDLFRLRDLKSDDVLSLIGEIQRTVDIDIAQADPAAKQALTAVSNHLKQLTQAIAGFGQKLDAALVPFRQKRNEIESWFDLVMVGFEERYNRSMKTWALAISFLVVFLLNANFFKIYETMSKNELARSLAVAQGEELIKKKADLKDAESQKKKAEEQKTQAEQQKKSEAAALEQQAKQEGEKVESLKQIVGELQKSYDDGAATYSSFGLDRLHWSNVKWWFKSWSTEDTWPKIGRNVVGLAGWLVTVLLISVGAPFWQDTLESLFGVKNLLRKKAGKQDVTGGAEQK